MRTKSIAAAVTATAFMGALLASPAAAQNQQEGLINVAIEDVIVQVPVSVAANICDVNVAVLVSEFNDDAAACEATATSTANAEPMNGPPTQQEGLVNVLLDDVLIQVPVSVAANVCDVNVALLADIVNDDAFACEATAESVATPANGPGNGSGDFTAVSTSGFTQLDTDITRDGGTDPATPNLVSPGTDLDPLPAGLTLLG
jgi:hypothetical protein